MFITTLKPNTEFGAMIAARSVILDGIHELDLMVPSVVNNEKRAWMTICRRRVQFARKKVAIDKGDDADILSFVPYAQAPQTCAAGNRMPSQDNLDTPVIHQRVRRTSFQEPSQRGMMSEVQH